MWLVLRLAVEHARVRKMISLAPPGVARNWSECCPSQLRVLDDEELMLALRDGCHDALAVLFERHSALAFRIARAILRDGGEAEETVQQVFFDLFRAVGQFNAERGSFKTWFLQFVYHRTINRRQHLQANRFYTFEELDERMPQELFRGAGRALRFSAHETKRLVEQVLAVVQPRQRRTIELTYFEGLTVEEIAKKTGESPKVVENNLYRGLARLRGAVLGNGQTSEYSKAAGTVKPNGVLVAHPRTL